MHTRYTSHQLETVENFVEGETEKDRLAVSFRVASDQIVDDPVG